MNSEDGKINKIANALGFSRVDTRVYSALSEFVDKVDVDSDSDARSLRESYLDFESCYYDLGLLLPVAQAGEPTLACDIMNTNVLSVSEDTWVCEVASILTRRMITGCPVVDSQGKLVGVVSVTDLAGLLAREEMLQQRHQLSAADVMTCYTVTVEPSASIQEILHLVLSFRLHRVIVVDSEKRPMGIVTTLDLARALKSLLSRETLHRELPRSA